MPETDNSQPMLCSSAGGGVSETADTQGPTAEAQATITKRLTIGGLITAGLAAFALVPTKDLRLKPRQPLHFYITQLLQAQVGCGLLQYVSFGGFLGFSS